MWSIIKSFFFSNKYYIRAVKTGTSDVIWQMEIVDIIKLFTKTKYECDVVRLQGDFTIFIGKR